jgi:hypothetical protein
MERLKELIKTYYKGNQRKVNFGSQIINDKVSFYGGFSYSDDLNNVFIETYNLVEKDFNHVDWLKRENIDTEKLLDKNTDFLIKYLFCLHRGEKFADGTIASAISNGNLDIALLSIINNELSNNFYWQNLSNLGLGKFSEYLAKIELLKYGFQVYQSEVDDRGIDFIAKSGTSFIEIQVKSVRLKTTNYVFFTKSELFFLRDSLFICLLIFFDNLNPKIYLIPSNDFNNNNGLFVDRDYNPEINKSKPEWGIQLSKKHLPKLIPYQIEFSLMKLNLINK